MPASIGNPIPAWLRPENASVLDSTSTKVLRNLATLLGVNDPQSQVLGLMAPLAAPEKEAANNLATLGKAAIKAYHGSPHDFEQFSLSKIGTGEGAQAYGHGLYFAENEKVAKGYRDALMTPTVEIMGQSQPVPSWNAGMSPQPRLIRRLADIRALHPNEPEQSVIDQVRRNIKFELTGKYTDDATRNALQSELDILAAAESRGIKTSPGGRMYEVQINAHPDQFLDWDKPLSQQPESLRYVHGYQAPPTQAEQDAVFALAKKRGVNPASLPEYKALEARMDAASKLDRDYPDGGTIYNEWMNDQRDVAIRQGRNADTTMPRSQEAASQQLRELGIPGIKYLDQGSRAAGEGSRNYVVFDDALVSILKKYGIALPVIEGLRRKAADQGGHLDPATDLQGLM